MRRKFLTKREHPSVTARKTVGYIEMMSGREIPELRRIMPAPPRTRAPSKPSGKPLEKEVLADVLLALRNDSRVAFCDRRQSGVFTEGNRVIRVGSRGVGDVSGMLIGGAYFEIEVKRPGEKPEPHQEERLAAIRANGGIAGCAHSAEEALALLP